MGLLRKVGGAATEMHSERSLMTVLSVSVAEKQSKRDFGSPLMVNKAPIFSLHMKHKVAPSESQQTLFTLLEKRREKYRRLIPRSHINGQTLSVRAVGNECAQQLTIGVHNLIATRQGATTNRDVVNDCKRNSVTCGVKYQVPSIATFYPAHCDNKVVEDGQRSRKSTPNLLDNLECRDLAEHVVSCAKVRLKRRRKRKLQSLQMYYNNSPSHQNRDRSIQSTTTQYTKATAKTLPANSPGKNNPVVHILSRTTRPPLKLQDQQSPSPQHMEHFEPDLSVVPISQKPSVSNCDGCNSVLSLAVHPLKVVYWSERHSITPKNTGVPNVPPVTPSASYSGSFKYVLSMSDIKSQRQLKSRLNKISERQQSSETKTTTAQEDEEKRKQREETIKLKEQQRVEIYALNKVMAAFEEQKFQDFISGRV